MNCLAPLNGSRPSYKTAERGFTSPCWIWQGARNSKGYAVRGTKDRRFLVHREAFVESGGLLAEGSEVHHRCEQRECVRPSHLTAMTPLAHRRGHGARLVEALQAALADGQLLRSRELSWIASDIGTTAASLDAVLRRMVARGEVRRVTRGVYALAEALEDQEAA